MNSKYRYLFVNTIAFLCGNMGTKFISFLLVPLYTNVLIPEEYGEIDLILSIAGVISPFIACGVHEAVMRFSMDKNIDQSLVLSIGLRIFLISSLITGVLFPLWSFIPIVSNNALFLYLYCVLNEMMTIFLCYIRGKDNINLYSFLGFLSALITAILNILLLVVLQWGQIGYKFSMLLSPALTTICAILLGKIWNNISIVKWDRKLAVEMIQYSLVLIPNAILWWCINASDRFFVSYMCGTIENGIYAVAYKIPSLLNTIASIFMQSWQMSAIKEYEEGSSEKFYETIYRMLTFFMGFVTLLLIIFNKTILNIYVAESYQKAWQYSPPLMVAFFIGSLSTFWGSFYIASKNTKKYLKSAMVGALVNVVLNFLLISLLGTIGAAIATMICYFAIFIARGYGMRNDINLKLFNIEVISSFMCMIIGLIAVYLPTFWSWTIGISNLGIYVFVNRKGVINLLYIIKGFLKRIKNRR